MIINTQEVYVLEWRRRTRDFQVSPMTQCLANNQVALMHQQPADQLAVWIGHKESCETMAKLWHGRLLTAPAELDVHGAPV